MSDDDDALGHVTRAAAEACERARADLAEAARELGTRGERPSARRLGLIAEGLAEPAEDDAAALERAITDALAGLAAVLRDLQTDAAASGAERATELVARTMARLYPLRRALAAAPEAEPEAMLLVTAKPRPRAVLQLVEQDDEDAPPASEEDRELDALRPDERRSQERVALEVDIGLHSETNFFAAYGDDVSEGGLFVATYDLLPVGSALTLSFVLPHGPQVIVRGRVAWLREADSFDTDLHPGMGVVFLDLDERGLAAIRDYMRRRAPIFYDG